MDGADQPASHESRASPASPQNQEDLEQLVELQALCKSQAARIVELENLCTQQEARIRELEQAERIRKLTAPNGAEMVSQLLVSPRTSLGSTTTGAPFASPRQSGPSEAFQRAKDLAELWGQRCSPQLAGVLPSPRPSPRSYLRKEVKTIVQRPTGMPEMSRSLLLPSPSISESRPMMSPAPVYPLVSSTPGSLLAPGRAEKAPGTVTIFQASPRLVPTSPVTMSPRPVQTWPEAKAFLWSTVTPCSERKLEIDKASLQDNAKTSPCSAPQPQERVRPMKAQNMSAKSYLHPAGCSAGLFSQWSQDADYLLRQEERLQQSRKSNSIIQNTAGATEEPT
ncbi:unnamed protein product [Durusdinium trenchii]|uniref:Uncharacterized protein n=2 Tax=Durusdinium trenchii TaxID=1381693 RepID=A0ABP0ST39_9DINO